MKKAYFQLSLPWQEKWTNRYPWPAGTFFTTWCLERPLHWSNPWSRQSGGWEGRQSTKPSCDGYCRWSPLLRAPAVDACSCGRGEVKHGIAVYIHGDYILGDCDHSCPFEHHQSQERGDVQWEAQLNSQHLGLVLSNQQHLVLCHRPSLTPLQPALEDVV